MSGEILYALFGNFRIDCHLKRFQRGDVGGAEHDNIETGDDSGQVTVMPLQLRSRWLGSVGAHGT